MAESVLSVLNRHATAIGSDVRLVQGAGGNLSGKDDGLVWVKASGTRLGEADSRPVFVGVDRERAAAEVLQREDLQHLVVELPDGASPRPSIETALHVLLPHRYVFHVHSVGSLAAAVQADPDDALRRLRAVAPVGWVRYAKPGIALARAVLESLADGGGADDADGDAGERVLVLANHGLVTAAASAERARELIDDVEAALRVGTEPGPVERELVAPAGSVTADGARLLTGGVLTPDEAVFLGPAPFGVADGTAPAVVGSDGSVRVRADLPQDARDLVLSLVHVVAHTPPGARPRYLTDSEVAELVDWEAEKWRQKMTAR